MEDNIAGKKLREYNALMRENDDIYREAIKKLGLPDGAFWILYTLRADGENSEYLTQSQISQTVYMPKQTLNSALKKLESAGFLELIPGPNRRSKYVRLTQEGKALAEKTADKLIAAENITFAQLTEEELDTMLRLERKFAELLRQNIKVLGKE